MNWMPLILFDLQARFRQRRGGETGRAFFERKPENAARRDRQHRVLHHVQSRAPAVARGNDARLPEW